MFGSFSNGAYSSFCDTKLEFYSLRTQILMCKSTLTSSCLTNFEDYNSKIYKFWRIKMIKHLPGLQKEWLHPVLPTE